MLEQEKQENDVLIVLATFNEIENVPTLVAQLLEKVPDADVLIVDDNSPDGTGRWALETAAKNRRVKALVRKNERGLGSAVVAALRYAIDNGYRRVVNMDADFSHPVASVPQLLARLDPEPAGELTQKVANKRLIASLKPVDVAIGSRYVRGGSVPDWPWKRRLTSRCVNLFARWTLGLAARDVSGAFRCYRVETLRNIDFDEIVSTGYSFFEEILYRLKRVGARFGEVPITFVDRKRGVSKVNKKEALRAILILLFLGLTRVFRFSKKCSKQ